MLPFFLKGISIGFLIAAPVGPIGVLCIRRSLLDGWRSGFLTGLGAATADALYGCVAAFGLTAISVALVNQRFWLGIVGGIFLCYLGIRTAIEPPATVQKEERKENLAGAYFSTVLLTLTNPATILSFIAVFAGFGLSASPNFTAAATLVLGVFLGSTLWWLLLSSVVTALQTRLSRSWLRGVNLLSGVILTAFGLVAVLSTLKKN